MASKTKRPPRRSSVLEGCATTEGTARYAARFAARFEPGHFRPLGPTACRASSIGLGTYLGGCTDDDDAQYAASIALALGSGINLLDTAINYRCQRSERAVGAALARAVRDERTARDEVIVCTKGGYVPLDGEQPTSRREYEEYLDEVFLQPGIIDRAELVGGAHCIAPRFLEHQIARSRANLGVATLDVYYLHNPEQQLDAVDRELFRYRLRAAFEMLEQCRGAGHIVQYGCATWDGLRAAPGTPAHLSLAELVQIAREVGGDAHGFRVVQLPLNLAMSEAAREATQELAGGQRVTVLQAAAELGVSVIASASLLQARLASHLPAELHRALPGLDTDAQRAIAFVRALPVVTSALVGMRTPAHVMENLGAARAR
ncbi:MAG TPA: aldo/keto reductase [Gemmatimonadaceae bacterium]|nr:aldo/keto reductase [Gemmatimonadaceae bacterium]